LAIAGTNYEPSYFDRQVAKSDAKIGWQYDRMLRFAGVKLPAGARALDLGCGAAPGLRYLGARGAVAVGADVSAAALGAARRLLPGARLVRCDLEGGLPFQSGRFELLLLSEIVEHVATLPALLAECRRVLAPGGALVLTTPNLWDLRRLVGALGGPTWTGYLDPTHVNLQSPRTLRAALVGAGFRAVRVRTGWKPLARLGGRRLPLRLTIPYPPLVGNGLLASGRA
jgi:SAM-dependent methyltransferase